MSALEADPTALSPIDCGWTLDRDSALLLSVGNPPDRASLPLHIRTMIRCCRSSDILLPTLHFQYFVCVTKQRTVVMKKSKTGDASVDDDEEDEVENELC